MDSLNSLLWCFPGENMTVVLSGINHLSHTVPLPSSGTHKEILNSKRTPYIIFVNILRLHQHCIIDGLILNKTDDLA